MSPWEALGWFAPIKESFVTLPNNSVTKLVGADPQRVVLVMSMAGGLSNSVNLATTSAVTTSGGWSLVTNAPFVVLTQRDHGPLAQADWFGICSTQIIVYTAEVLMRDWPQETPPAEGTLVAAIGELSRLIRRLTHALDPAAPATGA